MKPTLDSPVRPATTAVSVSSVAPDLVVGGGVTVAVAWFAGVVTGTGAVPLLGPTAALYLALSVLLIRGLPRHLPGPGLGPPNRITLGRAALVLPVAAFVMPGVPLTTTALWWVIGASTLALSLDGVDGRVARRTGTATPFGARFDMELDAFLLLALSVLVWQSGQVGGWVILIGALRYLFIAAGWVQPRLQGELPPSFRRKTVCVVQGVALLVALGPIIPPWLAGAVAGTALVLLVYSFGVDALWLLRHGEPPAG